jgi:hypothetical protein
MTTPKLSYAELATQLEALADNPPEMDAKDEGRIHLLEAAKRVVPELEMPGEAAQRVMYGVSARQKLAGSSSAGDICSPSR